MNNHFMEKTGKNDKLFVAYRDIFMNSQCLFVEYHDVIKSPWFIFLIAAKDASAFKELFDTFEIDDLSYDGIYEWYMNRKTINPLLSLPLRKDLADKAYDDIVKWEDDFLEAEIDNPDIVNIDMICSFAIILQNLLSTNVAKDIVIYTERYNKAIESDIANMFKNKVHYVHGNMNDVLKNIPDDSTYVFSDITKINTLKDCQKLNYSSVLIATRYGYNYNDDNSLVVDIDKLRDDYIFKINYFTIWKEI